MLYYIKDDLEVGAPPRPYIRHGLPSTVRINGGSSYVMLTPEWMKFVVKVNTPAGQKYQFQDYPINSNFKEAVGWHNQGKDNRVEQLTFSGNVVDVTRIEGNKAYIKCYYNSQKPPETSPLVNIKEFHPLIHFLTTQFSSGLDISTNGRYPRILVIANNESEQLWIDTINLAPIEQPEPVEPEPVEPETTMSELQAFITELKSLIARYK